MNRWQQLFNVPVNTEILTFSCLFVLKAVVHLLKLLWESALSDRSSGWTRLYHDRPIISSAEYPNKGETLKRKIKMSINRKTFIMPAHRRSCAIVPNWQLHKAHIQSMRVCAPQAVHCWGADSDKQWLSGGDGKGGHTEEASRSSLNSDQCRGAAAMFQLKGLGGFHATYKTPLWGKKTRQFSLSCLLKHLRLVLPSFKTNYELNGRNSLKIRAL